MATPVTAYADRVKDTSTTTGTGDITLSGTAPTGFVSFNTAFGTSTIFYYAIETTGADWEVGRGYLSASTTLVRMTVLASSNSGNAVNFSSGTKTLFCTWPAWVAQRSSTLGQDFSISRGVFLP